jgi:hypothetical protein
MTKAFWLGRKLAKNFEEAVVGKPVVQKLSLAK